jgi:hypothetical protein
VIARCVVFLLALSAVDVSAADPLADAQALFYDGRYTEASAMAQSMSSDQGMLPIYEFRTAALHFQIRDALGTKERDRAKAYNACSPCRAQFDLFMRELKSGQELARATLKENPKDATALYFLGKLDLNYVWLVLGTLGRRTGWNEFWEARHSIDALLADDPSHLRGRVARAWIEYIVDTRMPWGTAWMLGGGNKRKALAAMKEAAASEGEYYSQAEAVFGLWDMQVREGAFPAALVTARRLATQFPANRGVANFIERQSAKSR